MRLFFQLLSLCLTLLLASPVSGAGPTTVGGILPGDTTWTLAGSPYIVGSSVLVPTGVTLTIEAGVTVKVDAGNYIKVEGVLQAVGTAAQGILFTSSKTTKATGDWNGVSIRPTGGTTFSASGDYVSGSQFKYVTFEYASTGIYVYNAGILADSCRFYKNSVAVEVRKSSMSRFKSSTFDQNDQGFYSIYENYTGDIYGAISDLSITDNVFSGGSYGINLNSNQTAFKGMVISNNVLSGASTAAIKVGGGGNGPYAHSVSINGNRISGCGDAVVVDRFFASGANGLPGAPPLPAYPIDVFGNIITGNSGRPISAEYLGNSNIRIASNVVSGNSGDIQFTSVESSADKQFSGNAIVGSALVIGGDAYYHPDNWLITGNSFVRISKNAVDVMFGSNHRITNNNFIGNTGAFLVNNGTTADIIATGNYWGTADSAQVAALIYDRSDNFDRGQVNFTPFAAAPLTAPPISPPVGVQLARNGNDVVVTWNGNPESDIAGYRIYYGTTPGYPYANVASVGSVTTKIFPGLASGLYYFAVAAVDASASGGGSDLTNGNESALSAEMTTGVAVSITTQPANQTVIAGQTATFSVAASGNPAPTFQWKKSGVDIPGATGASLVLANAQAADAGTYSAVATNALGFVASNSATLTVNTPPVISSHPVSSTVLAGGNTTFSVTASGTPTPTYRWQRQQAGTTGFVDLFNDSTFSAVTTASLSITGAASFANGDQFRCVVTNSAGSVTSSAATLTVNQAPAITSINTVVFAAGQLGAFTITATGAPAPTFAIASGSFPSWATLNSGTGVISGTPPDGTGSPFTFTIQAGNGVGTATQSFTLTVNTPPAISLQPVNRTVVLGGNATFSVTATGTPAPTYQWQRQAGGTGGFTNLSSGGNYFFVTSANLSVTASSLSMTGDQFRCVVTNSLGSVTSTSGTLTVTQAPAITSASSATFIAGQAGSFTVTATGAPAPTFSITSPYPGWANIDAVTGVISGTPPSGTGGTSTITVQASNGVGTPATQSFTLTVNFVPVISNQPANQTVTAGFFATFQVTASANPAPTYQWQKNGAPISGATNASLTFNSAQPSDAASYTVVITNSVGAVTSSTATLTVNIGPTITTQPVSTTVNQGQAATFTVAATGTPAPTYQWRKNSVNITGATDATLTLTNVQAADAASYTVVVSNSVSSVTSNSATLSVNTLPVISTQPISTSANLGASASLSVVATGTPAPTYQWRKAGVAVSGATNATLSFSSTQQSNAGDYDVVITNVVGAVTSNVATLTVVTLPPSITTQPVGGTVGVGGGFTFSVVAGGSPTLSYQWRRNGISFAGATSASFGIPNAQTWDTGDYDVVVTNPFGTVTSSVARLTVVPRPVAISGRVVIGSGEPAIAIFTVEGPSSKTLLLRVVGPGITPFGFTNVVPDPQLDVFDSAANLVASNNDWSTASNAAAIVSTTSAVGAFGLASGSRDSVVLQSFAPGNYSVRATGNGGVGGVAYLELYDADLPANTSRIPFVAVRARVAPGDAIMVGGLASNGRGVRSYLIRAAGPALGLTEAFANPSLVVARESALVGSNDDWDAVSADGAAVTTATSRVTAFPFTAGSRDAAIVVTGNLHAGAHTVQVGGASGAGVVLLELHDLDASRPLAFAPVIVSPPVAQAVATGGAISLTARAHGTAPLSYQWRKDGVNIPNATAQTYSVATAQSADGGVYSVVVTNSLGTATSLSAQVTVGAAGGSIAATHGVVGGGYNPGGTVTISNTISFTGTASSLGWNVTLPAGWAFVSDAGVTAQVKPVGGTTGTLGWAWSDPVTSPQTFTYTLSVPSTESVPRNITANAIVRTGTDAPQTLVASPNPLTVSPMSAVHSADTNQDGAISLFELTRVIELYNTRNGTSRTGCYQVDPNGEDGFAPNAARAVGSSATLARYHSADTRGAATGSPRDGAIDLFELTRVIELYNYRTGTTRTGQYHVQAGTEDGFAPGP